MDIKMEIKTEPGHNKSLQNRTTPVQFGILISFMEQHQDLAFNTVLDKILYRDLWNELTTHLNSNGPPIKTKDRWMKVWADLKSDIRKKLRAHAGDGKCKRYGLLSAKDERVINLLNLRNPEVTNNMKNKRSPRASVGSTPRPSTSFDDENDSFDGKPAFNSVENPPPTKVQHMLDYDDDEFDEDDYNDKTSMLECELQNNSEEEMNTDKVMISASLLKEHIMNSQISEPASLTVLQQNRTSPLQFEVLIDFMEEHPDLAHNCILDKNVHKTLWDQLALRLNSNGPPIKSKDRWMKVWADLKSDIRKKLRVHSSGIKSRRYGPLSTKDDRVINLLNLRTPEAIAKKRNKPPNRSSAASLSETDNNGTASAAFNGDFNESSQFSYASKADQTVTNRTNMAELMEEDDDDYDDDYYNDKTSMLECELQSDPEEIDTEKSEISPSLLNKHIRNSQIRFTEIHIKLDELSMNIEQINRMNKERYEIEKNILKIKQQDLELKRKLFELQKRKYEATKI